MRPLCTSSKDETFTLNSIKVEWIKFFLTSSVFHRPVPLKFSLCWSATRREMAEICDVPSVIFLEEIISFCC